MATQSRNRYRPVRTLLIFALFIAALYALMGATKSWSPKLGLDLQGGTTITLTARNSTGQGQVDPTSLELARTIIQQRVDSLGVGESEVTTQGGQHIVVSVPNVQQDELVRMVGKTAQLSFRALYDVQPVAVAPTEDPSASASPSAEASGSASATPSAGQTAANSSATPRSAPQPQLPTAPPAPKSPRPSVEKSTEPASADARTTWLDGRVAWEPSQRDQLDFSEWTCGDPFPDVADQPLFACNEDKTEKYLLGPVLIEGDNVTSAQAGIPDKGVSWEVNLGFNDQGAKDFEKITGVLAQRQEPLNRFAIVLDGEVISSPSLENAIPGGQARIFGSFTQQSATQLANILKYGSLPLTFDVSSVDNVSATLGAVQLRAGIIAGLIGLGLVLVYSLIYYRGLAVIVLSSLAIAAALTYAVMVLLGESVGFALNLPGIAGAIVAIGVTADSFIIYFERIRDEVREGRSLKTAIETGWQKSRRTIVIADMVSLLSALVLFILAIGAVRGFAFTLGLTTLIDLAIVFWFTKPMVTLLGRTKFFGGGHRWSGFDAEHMGVDESAYVPRTRGRAAVKEA